MTTILSEGVIVPDVGDVNWAGKLEVNWNLLNGALANLSGNVKLDRDNTWTGEQSFTLPIVGSITGTASKAIADEDGTSIKTGYVNVAGNQAVTGDKSFTGSNTFNNILPNATNTYSLGSSSYQWSSVYAQTYYYNGTAWGLDKSNVWAENNRFSKNSALSDITSYTDTSMSFTGNSNTILFNTRGSSNYPSYGTFLFAGYTTGTAPDRYGQLKLVRSTDIKGGTYDGYKPDTSFNLWRVAPHYSLMDFVDAVRVQNDGTNNYIAPITTNATDLGTSTNQWSSVYAQTYYYNGTAWGLDKSNVWTASNTYSAGNAIIIKNNGIEIGNEPSAYNEQRVVFNDKNGYGIAAIKYQNQISSSNVFVNGLEFSISDKFKNGVRDATGTTITNVFRIGLWNDGTKYIYTEGRWRTSLIPFTNNATDLGTSTNKWKSLNGVNPGALSLPDYSRTMNIDTTNWPKDGNKIIYTPTVNGWLQITIPNDDDNNGIKSNMISILDSGTNPISGIANGNSNDLRIYCLFPVIANREYWIYIKSYSNTITTARIVQCLGNV